jgi:hypothetical protein
MGAQLAARLTDSKDAAGQEYQDGEHRLTMVYGVKDLLSSDMRS